MPETPQPDRIGVGIRHHFAGALLSVICAGPIVWIIYRSVMAGGSGAHFTLDNYTRLLKNPLMLTWLWNSFFVAVTTTVLVVVIDIPAAYAIAKTSLPGRQLLFGLLMATIMLPSALTLIPTYLLAVRYHLINSLWGIILPSLAGPLGIYLLRQYILGLPRELFEAARVDGASHLRTLVSIVAPLIRQPTIVLGVLTFVASWNSFIWPLLIGQTQEKMTLPVGIATGNLQFSTDTSAVLAQAVVSVIPTAILFAFLQRAFTAGITAGATKG